MTDIEVPMPCAVVHTKYQPTEEEWKCPKCGVGSSLFYIEDPADKTDDCDLLHNDMVFTAMAVITASLERHLPPRFRSSIILSPVHTAMVKVLCQEIRNERSLVQASL
jgi:hypothetical protein